jgi:hypothetical protein
MSWIALRCLRFAGVKRLSDRAADQSPAAGAKRSAHLIGFPSGNSRPPVDGCRVGVWLESTSDPSLQP